MKLGSLGKAYNAGELAIIDRIVNHEGWPAAMGYLPAGTILNMDSDHGDTRIPIGWPVNPLQEQIPPNVRVAVMWKLDKKSFRPFFFGGIFGTWTDLKTAMSAEEIVDENTISNLPYSLILPPDNPGTTIRLDSNMQQYISSHWLVNIPSNWVWRYIHYEWSTDQGAWYLGPSDADIATYDSLFDYLKSQNQVQVVSLNFGGQYREQFAYADPRLIDYDLRYGLITPVTNVLQPLVPDNSLKDIVTFIALAFGMYSVVMAAGSVAGNLTANEALSSTAMDGSEIYQGAGAQPITSESLTSAGSYSEVTVTPLDTNISYTGPDLTTNYSPSPSNSFSTSSNTPASSNSFATSDYSPTGDVSNPLGNSSNPMGNTSASTSSPMDGSEIYQGPGAQPITGEELTSAGAPSAEVTAGAGGAGTGSSVTSSLVTKLGAGLLTALIPKNSPPVKPVGSAVVPLSTTNNTHSSENYLLWVIFGGIVYAMVNKDKRDNS